MKKIFSALIALSLLMSCLPAAAGASSVELIRPVGWPTPTPVPVTPSLQFMPAHETNYGYALRGANICRTPNGSVIATATPDHLLYFTGSSANDMATGKLWIEVNIISTSTVGYVLADSVTFMTRGEYQAYMDMANATPTPQPTMAPLPTPTPLVQLITPRPTTAPGGTVIDRAVVTTNGGGLNLRMWDAYSAPVILTIPRNTTVDVYQYSGNWARVRYAGVEGWVVRSFLSSGYTPAPTYQPAQPAQGYAYVQTNGGGLNLRSYAGSDAKVLMVIPRYARVEVLSYGASWSYVRYAGVVGYVVSSFLNFNGPIASPTAAPTYNPGSGYGNYGYAVVSTQSGGLNMRASAYVGAKILTVIPKGAAVNVLNKGTTWSYVTYGSHTGYVMTGFLSFTGAANTVTSTRALATASGNGLNLRQYASSSAKVVTVIPTMSEVSVLQRGDIWTRVRYAGMTGYVMTAYLTFLP